MRQRPSADLRADLAVTPFSKIRPFDDSGSLQFSVILLGTYGAGFFALRTAQTFGYTAAYGVALVLGLAAGAALWFGRNRLDIADGKAA